MEKLDAESTKSLKVSETDTKLYFSENSKFSQDSLRVPASEIKRYETQLAAKSEKLRIAEKVGLGDIQPDKPFVGGGRENQLHSLITCILKKNLKISSKKVWQILKERRCRDRHAPL